MNKLEPGQMQTAAGFPEVKIMGTRFVFTDAEKQRLRALAARVAEIAALPVQSEKAKLWQQHNDLKTTQPLVFIDPENGWNECIPKETLMCLDPMARVWEMHLNKQIYWFEKFKDDKVIENYFDVPYSYTHTGWGLELIKHGGESGGAYIVEAALKEYETDFPKVHYPQIIIDEAESNRVLELAHDVFDGILNVRRKHTWWWTLGLTWEYINLRGLENFMCDLIMEPEYVHRMMSMLCQGVLKKLDDLEENNLLAQNTGGTYVGSGGFGFTDDLADKQDAVTTMDLWGFVESQETSAVDPKHYGEFIFPYHKRIAERFGLNCYGCCEAFDPRWEYVSKLPRLRRVSCSPWAAWERIPEYLGKRYIASVKPSPAYLAIKNMDEEVVRSDLRRALRCTRDCIPELIMKDNNTLGGNPNNAVRWVEIAREEIHRGNW